MRVDNTRREHLEPAVGRRRLRLHYGDDGRHGLRRGHFVDRELQSRCHVLLKTFSSLQLDGYGE